MAAKTHQEAITKICWLGIESGETFYCWGEDCSAWEREHEFDRKKRGTDITPHGYCLLLEARIRAAVD